MMDARRRMGSPESTQAIEDYLKAVYKLSARGGPPTVGSVAARLGVSAPSVTNMLKRMARLGLVQHAPYGRGVLAPRGERIALEIIRHHRLWELYLTRRLGLPLERVDAEAERLEHVMSDDMEDRIVALLGDPGLDPHGDPIPPRRGSFRPRPGGRKLSELRRGEEGVVTHVSDSDPGRLRRIAALGLLPGARVRLRAGNARSRTLTVDLARGRRTVGRDAAELVRVVSVSSSGLPA